MSDEEISQLFKVIDQDQTGRVSYSEFLAATLNRKFYLNENRMREAFARLDVDGDGRITLENMRIVMGDDFDEARVRKMIDVRGHDLRDLCGGGRRWWDGSTAACSGVVGSFYSG